MFSVIGIIGLSLILVITAIAIKVESKGKVFFKQEIIGENGELFKVYKFRSMIENSEKIGSGLYFDGENDRRITKVGRFIRKTSIDELPQLFNVIKDEMSLVGPR